MQWIKTLIIVLAFFWGGDALFAQPQPKLLAKNITTPISSDTNLLLSWTGPINSSVLNINSNNQQIINTPTQKKSKVKYRCGSKRFKNFALRNIFNQVDVDTQQTTTAGHRHSRYCWGKYCCGKKTWRQRAFETFETKELSTSHFDKAYSEYLPEEVLPARSKSLNTIAPRE